MFTAGIMPNKEPNGRSSLCLIFLPKKQESKYAVLYVRNFDTYAALPKGTKRILERLWQYEFPKDVINRLKKKFPFNSMSSQEITICVDEFKKFMAVMVIGKNTKERRCHD